MSSDRQLDDELRAFLLDQKEHPLRLAVERLADRLSEHLRDCREYRVSQSGDGERRDRRVSVLEQRELDRDHKSRPGWPPVREEGISSHNLEDFADRVAKSALEGFTRPDSTPEEEVRAVVEAEAEKRAERKELADLRAERDAIRFAAAARRKLMTQLAIAVAGSGGLVEVIHQVVKLVFLRHP